MDALKYFIEKYHPDMTKGNPVKINFGRNDFGKILWDLGLNTGGEIGTEQGHFAEIICRNHPYVCLHCVDPWVVYDENRGYKEDITQMRFEEMYQETVTRLKPYAVDIIRETSMEAVKGFQDNSLDFVYIDGNHRLEYVVQDIVEWTKKVKPGGIVAGHDYMRYKNQCYSHVVEAVIAYNEAYRRTLPYFVLENKRGGNARSWFFIK